MGEPCRCCGDSPSFPSKKGPLCLDCWREIFLGVIPSLKIITSRASHVPKGVRITQLGRRPGTGEGNDYFGNHT